MNVCVGKENLVNIQEINKIHFVHNYLDKGWKAYIQNSRVSSDGAKSKRRRIILKSKDVASQIVIPDGVYHKAGYGINKIDEEWVKENRKLVCIYSFLHNTLRKGWMIQKQKERAEKEESPFFGTYCFSKPHNNQVKYLSQSYLHKFVEDNVNDELIECF